MNRIRALASERAILLLILYILGFQSPTGARCFLAFDFLAFPFVWWSCVDGVPMGPVIGSSGNRASRIHSRRSLVYSVGGGWSA